MFPQRNLVNLRKSILQSLIPQRMWRTTRRLEKASTSNGGSVVDSKVETMKIIHKRFLNQGNVSGKGMCGKDIRYLKNGKTDGTAAWCFVTCKKCLEKRDPRC